jgi:hypothetical protein
LYSSQIVVVVVIIIIIIIIIIIKVTKWEMRCERHAAHISEIRNVYTILVGTYEGKRPIGRPRRTWEDNIKMALKEIRYKNDGWI